MSSRSLLRRDRVLSAHREWHGHGRHRAAWPAPARRRRQGLRRSARRSCRSLGAVRLLGAGVSFGPLDLRTEVSAVGVDLSLDRLLGPGEVLVELLADLRLADYAQSGLSGIQDRNSVVK